MSFNCINLNDAYSIILKFLKNMEKKGLMDEVFLSQEEELQKFFDFGRDEVFRLKNGRILAIEIDIDKGWNMARGLTARLYWDENQYGFSSRKTLICLDRNIRCFGLNQKVTSYGELINTFFEIEEIAKQA